MLKMTLAAATLLSSVAVASAETPPRPTPPAIDQDSDGWVTRSEAEAAANALFAQRDIDSDGRLEPEDRANRRGSGTDRRSAPPRSRADGPRPHHGPPPMMMLAHSKEADANSDDVLSQSEFVALHLRFFDAADVNGDGKIALDAPPRQAPKR